MHFIHYRLLCGSHWNDVTPHLDLQLRPQHFFQFNVTLLSHSPVTLKHTLLLSHGISLSLLTLLTSTAGQRVLPHTLWIQTVTSCVRASFPSRFLSFLRYKKQLVSARRAEVLQSLFHLVSGQSVAPHDLPHVILLLPLQDAQEVLELRKTERIPLPEETISSCSYVKYRIHAFKNYLAYFNWYFSRGLPVRRLFTHVNFPRFILFKD